MIGVIIELFLEIFLRLIIWVFIFPVVWVVATPLILLVSLIHPHTYFQDVCDHYRGVTKMCMTVLEWSP